MRAYKIALSAALILLISWAAPAAVAKKGEKKRIKSDQYETQGRQLLDERRYTEAWQYESEALKLNPANPLAYLDRGWALWYLNRTKDALLDFTSAIKYDPSSQPAYAARAMVYRKLGNTKNMTADRIKSAQLLAAPLRAKHVAELSQINRDIQNHNGDEVFLIRRAQKYFEMADFSQAVKDATAAIAMNRYNEDAYDVRGRAYDILGQTDGYARDNAEYKKLCGKDIYAKWADKGASSSWEDIVHDQAKRKTGQSPLEEQGWKVP